MKFTSEDLMKAMGLTVGDRIKIGDKIFEIYISPQNELRCTNIHNPNNHFYFKNIIDKEIEIIPKPKGIGDLECTGNCKNCPLMSVCSWDSDYQGKNLYEVLDYELTTVHDDQEIYDLLKARLDKEVSE